MKPKEYVCEILDTDVTFTVTEVCELSGVSDRIVFAMIREGVVEPQGGATPPEWRLNALAVRRITTAVRLQRDLGVNLPGAALALDLLDELEQLRRMR